MKTIKLTKEKVALVDTEGLEKLSKHKWRTFVDGNTFYAVTTLGKRPNRKLGIMHRMILGAKKGQIVDHINGDGLDNRKSNLRFCTISQNAHNRHDKPKNGYWGVSFKARRNKWYSYVTCKRKTHHLGCFDSIIDAARAHDVAAKKLLGEFARLNFQ